MIRVSIWKPRLRSAVDIRVLPLTVEEGFVASRLDGRTTVQDLSALTGLPPEKLEEALANLVVKGAVEPSAELLPSEGPQDPEVDTSALPEEDPEAPEVDS